MKIKDIKTFILRQDIGDKAFHSSQARFSIRSSMIVRIETVDGSVGWGKGGQYGPPEPPATCINDILASQLIVVGARMSRLGCSTISMRSAAILAKRARTSRL